MRNLTDFALRLEYERVKDLGDKLVDIGGRLNWEEFRPLLEAMYKNNTERGGRPHLDVIVMLKSLFIQQLTAYPMSSLNGKLPIASRLECFLAQQRLFQIPQQYGSSENALLRPVQTRKYGLRCKDNLML